MPRLSRADPFSARVVSSIVKRANSTSAQPPFRFTLSIPRNTLKKNVVNTLRANQPRLSAKTTKHDALVVLATPSLAPWLEDETFMSSAITSILGPRPHGTSLYVVGAVVDGMATSGSPTESSPGMSVLSGTLASLVPGLTYNNTVAPRSRRSSDSSGGLSFRFPGDRPDGVGYRVTLVLANTIFHNQRRSTLLASRWSVINGANKLKQIGAKHSLEIIYPTRSSPADVTYTLPLVPVTAPREIIHGFGNIVRKVDISGTPTLASKELEAVIPTIVEARRQSMESGPVGVWALVMPPGLNPDELPPLPTSFNPEDESKIVQRMLPTLSRLLKSGCTLHQVLSGGGGWGKKKGLLALDPEVSFDSPDDEGVEMLEQSLASSMGGVDHPGARDSIAKTGSFVQFFVTPLDYPAVLNQESGENTKTPSTVFGISQQVEDGANGVGGPTSIELTTGLFQAISRGIFVGPDQRGRVSSKINAPHATFSI